MKQAAKLDDRIKDALLSILTSVEKEDEYLLQQQMREFKKNNLFWHGFQYLFWSQGDMDWRVPTHEQMSQISSSEETRWIFDYVINHFKAHGESIIAALSSDIPSINFGPVNAQDPNDHRAVNAANNCVELIEKWNQAKLLIINAMFHLATEGFVASYTYNRKDESYGTAKIPIFDVRTEQTTPDSLTCPQCGYSEPAPANQLSNQQVPDQQAPPSGLGSTSRGGGEGEEGGIVQPMNDLPDPATAESEAGQESLTGQEICPECGAQMQVSPGMVEEVPFMSGEKPMPKGREVIEIYGPLNVRVPAYVNKQADAGWCLHYVDADPAQFQDAFPDYAEEIGTDPSQDYGRQMRQTSIVLGGFQTEFRLSTQKRLWARPWMLNRLGEQFDDVKDQMRRMFKTGIYFSAIDKTICEWRDESMDKHWTLTKAGPSKGLHADPLLKSTVPLQELRNNLTNMLVMMVEYGVPATYADPEVYDFKGQSKQEVSPGYVYPAKPRPGQSIGDAFYTEKTATLPREASELLSMVTEDEQFVTGSYPSIYGGPSQGGSKTLGEYDKSRSFALQRLSLVYYFLNVWWGETMHKSVLSFIDHQLEDESLTVAGASGSWQTKWIKKADFAGSFDRLEPEASADIPVSFAQKRSTIMALAQLNNSEINSVVFSPENADAVKGFVGIHELKVPGESQRRKQIREIVQMIAPANSAGAGADQFGDGQMMPLPIEPDIDNHEIHIEVLIEFLSDDVGQDLKEVNPQVYATVLAHLLEHKQALLASSPPPSSGGGPSGSAPPNKKEPKPVGPPPPEAAAIPGGSK